MQRWKEEAGGYTNMMEHKEGGWVRVSDAEAAIAAAEQRGRNAERLAMQPTIQEALEQGQRDMLAKCIAAVEALDTPAPWIGIVAALAALRALQEKP
jgi:hypothetical protein